MKILERYVAVDNRCAWPNLTRMPDGTLTAAIFGEPTHGRWEGNAECWGSSDGGRTWNLLGIPAPHEPGTNRMNMAAGLTHSGALVVLCSGWSKRPPRPPEGEPRSPHEGEVLQPWVCRSEDGGLTWTQHSGLCIPPELCYAIPFGDIIQVGPDRLAVSCYSRETANQERQSAWIFFSTDDGCTWTEAYPIAEGCYNETDLLSLGETQLLAASRTAKPDQHLEIFASSDAGRTWIGRGAVSLSGQIPGHLCRLDDGTLLLTYGVRSEGLLGVCARESKDQGASWDTPRVLFHTERVDGGYPSSVEMTDGTIVTAYYCASIPAHQRYHMGIVCWKR